MKRRHVAAPSRNRKWTQAEIAHLAHIYPHQLAAEVASVFGRSRGAVCTIAAKHGICKSAKFVSEHSREIAKAHGFQKGLVPHNKGLRLPGYAPGRMGETQFKKGNRTGRAAEFWAPIGSIREDSEGYVRIKISEAKHRWPLLHRFTWEQKRGPIPTGHFVKFSDGDRKNCRLENLELISRADMIQRNSLWANYPRELAEAIHLNGALKRQIRERTRG